MTVPQTAHQAAAPAAGDAELRRLLRSLGLSEQNADNALRWMEPSSPQEQAENLRQARHYVSLALEPAPVEDLGKWLALVASRTVERSNSDEHLQFMLADLQEHPADIVKFVLFKYRGTHFPATNELLPEIEELSAYRRRCRQELISPGGPPASIGVKKGLKKFAATYRSLAEKRARLDEIYARPRDERIRMANEMLDAFEKFKETNPRGKRSFEPIGNFVRRPTR